MRFEYKISGLPHLSMLPHLPGVPHRHVHRPLELGLYRHCGTFLKNHYFFICSFAKVFPGILKLWHEMSIFLYFLSCLVIMATNNAKNKPPWDNRYKNTSISKTLQGKLLKLLEFHLHILFLCNELKAFLSG